MYWSRSGAKSDQTCPRNVQNGALEGPQWSPGGSKMESRRFQNGARRVQNGGQWPKMGASKGPNATPSASERLKCCFELAKPTPKCVPGSPGPARAQFCVRFWAPEGAPRGPKSEQKVDQKCLHKHLRFRSRFGAKFYRFWGPKNVIFGTRKRDQVHIQIARCIRKMYWKNQLKINILELELGEILKKKRSKKRHR